MNQNSNASPDQLLVLARAGSKPALGELLERYRNYLDLLGQVEIGRRLQGKMDAADLVQETFLQASRNFAQFRGETERELVSWLREILASRLAKALRHYCGTQRRDVHLERQLANALERSSQALDQNLVDPGSSPSQQAARREQAVLLADALQRVPPDYRTVLVLHQLQGQSFPEVARQMGRNVESVKKLWLRALPRLRQAMGESP